MVYPFIQGSFCHRMSLLHRVAENVCLCFYIPNCSDTCTYVCKIHGKIDIHVTFQFTDSQINHMHICICRYLHFVRKLQTVYRMEPAGSHGVWSLDDFQFLPFMWGSSQLIGTGLSS